MRTLLVTCALLALASCHKPAPAPQSQVNNAQSAESGPAKGVDRSHRGQPFPKVRFGDPDGTQTDFKGVEGVPTLVNLWATWCAPCVKELPTLSKLAQSRKADLSVLAISQDSAPKASVDAFVAKLGLQKFPVYYDPKMAVSGATDAEVLPTTILYDANGHEVWRYVGDLDWTSPQAAKLLSEAGVTRAQ
ncbi:MAG TPA: TlpA disulfide reductase family protein [Sphingomicrobium sp.]|nr:TlpA disulfide reductase family protein [Sphingomicrobium sp.]